MLGMQKPIGLRVHAHIPVATQLQQGATLMSWLPWIPVVIAVLQVVKDTMNDD